VALILAAKPIDYKRPVLRASNHFDAPQHDYAPDNNLIRKRFNHHAIKCLSPWMSTQESNTSTGAPFRPRLAGKARQCLCFTVKLPRP